jgi:hypothetical protein
LASVGEVRFGLSLPELESAAWLAYHYFLLKVAEIVRLLLVSAALVGCGGTDVTVPPPPTPTPSEPTPAPTTIPPAQGSGEVRVLYVIPSDRSFRRDYSEAVEFALHDLRVWYAGQLAGRTFWLREPVPEVCRLPQPAAYYAVDSWTKVLDDVQGCAPVSYGSDRLAWVLYVDIIHTCDAPGRLGAGASGLTMMPRQDMDGLIGAPYIDDCGIGYDLPISRYVGGAGHELGHALGLPHPPGCDTQLPSCDSAAIMAGGYASYPNTHLTEDDKATLFASSFIR